MSLAIDLHGKKALVTGVSGGIGLGIAEALARAGCDVAGCAREAADGPGPEAFRRAVGGHGGAADYRSCDLSDAAAAPEWVRQAAAALGGCDLLVSNAGRNVFKGAAACTNEDWNAALELDLAAHWRVARAARPWLEAAEGGGVIIAITSNHAWSTIPGCFPYNVAKAGMVALVQSLMIEWGPRIRAVGIAPGFIDTPGGQTWFDGFPDPAAERAATERRHPVGRLGTVGEIGGLCAFLASPWAGFISGTTLLVDGGRSALMQD